MSPSQNKTSSVRIYTLSDKDLPDVARKALDVINNEDIKPKKESLHSIFKRKGITCFCTQCYEAKVYNKSIV